MLERDFSVNDDRHNSLPITQRSVLGPGGENLVFLRKFSVLRLRLSRHSLPADLGSDPADCSEQACFMRSLAYHPAGSAQGEERVLVAAEGRDVPFQV